MGIGELLLIGLLILVSVPLLGGLGWLWYRRPPAAPSLRGIGPDALLFFHSASCGPCRAMQPHVEEMSARDPRVHLLDVRDRPDAAQAYQVRSTPTLVAVRRGRIREIRLGMQSPKILQGMLPLSRRRA